MNHTPGKWRRGDTADYGVILSEPNTPGGPGDGKEIALVCIDDMDPEEFEANVDLIAAAPDLLNALQELVLRTRQFIAGELVTFPAALLPQCEAIISKATGR